MNFGFHDVFSLTEKLAKIWTNEAEEDLLIFTIANGERWLRNTFSVRP